MIVNDTANYGRGEEQAMQARTLLLPLVLVALALPLAAQGAERAKAKVDCTPAEQRYLYDCMIMLTGKKSGKPIAGAEVMVGADMPAMPMAHNTKPVKAMAMQQPGMYHARIALAMHGEWALTMEVWGPMRDKVIHTMQFGPMAGERAGMVQDHGAMKAASGTPCQVAGQVTDEAERAPGGALYAGEAKAGSAVAGAHMVHQPQRGGAFFMAPDKLHHVEAIYSEVCGLRVFFYNIRTEPIGVTRFRAFARVIPESMDEPEVLRFLTPVEDGTLLAANLGDEATRPFEIELYIRFPEGDEPQLFTVRVPAVTQ